MTFYFHFPSMTKDLTINVRNQVIECVYKSALYTALKWICHSTILPVVVGNVLIVNVHF